MEGVKVGNREGEGSPGGRSHNGGVLACTRDAHSTRVEKLQLAYSILIILMTANILSYV